MPWRPATLITALLDLFFPERCAACGQLAGLFCAACAGSLRPYPPEPPTPGLDEVRVAWLYEGAVRRSIHRLKYHKQRRAAVGLADALARALGDAPACDALVPVPLHAGRLAERGFNQSEELARALGRRWGLPVRADGLVRQRDTGHQADLARRDRLTNVQGAFAWQASKPPPARLLLVDDVLTTGATLAACAAALRAAGAQEVRAVALARSLAPGQRAAGSRATMHRDALEG
jgi:ComF family protein